MKYTTSSNLKEKIKVCKNIRFTSDKTPSRLELMSPVVRWPIGSARTDYDDIKGTSCMMSLEEFRTGVG